MENEFNKRESGRGMEKFFREERKIFGWGEIRRKMKRERKEDEKKIVFDVHFMWISFSTELLKDIVISC
jgi:hypothetical protein